MRKKVNIIELSCVAAILAVTLFTVIPLVRASVNDDIERCAANGKKVHQALLMYMDDYSGRFPSGMPNSVAFTLPTWNYTWFTEKGVGTGSGMAVYRYYYLKKYVKDDSIWICSNPSSSYAKRFAYKYRTNWVPRSSDDFFDGDRGFVGGSSYDQGLTVAEVEALDAAGQTQCGPRYMPSNKKIIAMCYGIGEWGSANIGNSQLYVFPAFPHKDGSVFVYVDGHAAWQRMGQGWAPAGYTRLDVDKVPATRPQY